jgi:hypothetical protein
MSWLGLLLLPTQAAPDTSLPTTITSDQTWTAAGSPYTGASVTIASGVTVTVEPGAVVKLTGDLIVNGTLDARGTVAQPITFTSTTDSAAGQWANQWGGIEFGASSTGSILDRVEVRFAGGNDGSALQANGASPQITN